ncbi:hypothetical protein HM2_03210 [Candidatus Rickettsia kotlanii]|nr:hypothetical protein HM2_03210 [Candidatus Rickettsia kotlanii]
MLFEIILEKYSPYVNLKKIKSLKKRYNATFLICLLFINNIDDIFTILLIIIDIV